MVMSCAAIAMVVAVDTYHFPTATVVVMTLSGFGASVVDWLIRRSMVFPPFSFSFFSFFSFQVPVFLIGLFIVTSIGGVPNLWRVRRVNIGLILDLVLWPNTSTNTQ